MKKIFIAVFVFSASLFSHAQNSADGTAEFYKRFSEYLKNGAPNTAFGTNYVVFKGTSQYGDSCELKIDEYRVKATDGSQLVVYQIGLHYQFLGEKSGHDYSGNSKDPVDIQRHYDLSTGMDLPLKISSSGDVNRILSSSAANAAGYYAHGDVSSWSVRRQKSKLIINQSAMKNYWGSRNLEFTFTPNGTSIASVSLVSLKTNGRYTCKALKPIPVPKI